MLALIYHCLFCSYEFEIYWFYKFTKHFRMFGYKFLFKIPSSFVVDLFGVLWRLAVCWYSDNGIGHDPWVGRCGRINISRRPLSWTCRDMPLFSRVRSARLLTSRLVLILSLVCPARMENTVLFQQTCCLLSIPLAIFVRPLLLLLGIEHLGILVYSYRVAVLCAASLATLSANSLPCMCMYGCMYVCIYVYMYVCM